MGSHKQRVERLEGPQETGALIVVGKGGESGAEAVQRHLAEHPEDEDRDMIVICCSAAPRDPQGAPKGSGNTTSRPDESVRPLKIIRCLHVLTPEGGNPLRNLLSTGLHQPWLR